MAALLPVAVVRVARLQCDHAIERIIMRTIASLLALGAALVYIVRLRQALAESEQRADMYRDIAAALDRQYGASGVEG